jgi:hypothetical protein
MKFLSRQNKNWNKPFSEKISKRVSKIPIAELEQYADQSLYDIGRNLSAYGRGKNKEYLEEALLASEVLHAIVDEIYKRNTRV